MIPKKKLMIYHWAITAIHTPILDIYYIYITKTKEQLRVINEKA